MEKTKTITLEEFEAYFLRTLLEGGINITDSKTQQEIFRSILSKLKE